MSYRLAYERLKAYEPKQLCLDRYHNYEGDRCALGVIVPETTRYICRSIRLICEGGLWGPPDERVLGELRALEMSVEEAIDLQRANDGFVHVSQEERYASILVWLEAKAQP